MDIWAESGRQKSTDKRHRTVAGVAPWSSSRSTDRNSAIFSDDPDPRLVTINNLVIRLSESRYKYSGVRPNFNNISFGWLQTLSIRAPVNCHCWLPLPCQRVHTDIKMMQQIKHIIYIIMYRDHQLCLIHRESDSRRSAVAVRSLWLSAVAFAYATRPKDPGFRLPSTSPHLRTMFHDSPATL